MKYSVLSIFLISLTLAGDVEVTFQALDSPVSQLQWCGASVVFTKDDEVVEQTHSETRKVVFILTDKGYVWKSMDYGTNWIQESHTLERLAQTDKLFFESIQISPFDSRVIFIFSSSGQSFRSKDCGRNYKMFKHDEELYDFKLNKMDDKWIMAFKDKPCMKGDPDCREYYKKSLQVTKDGGDTWRPALEYVREASWDKLLQYQMVPDERIIACHIKNGKSVVSFSDDYFETLTIMNDNGQGYFQTSFYVFVLSKTDPFSDDYSLLISPAYLDRFIPQEIQLPIQQFSQHSFTILDTSEGQIFISVSHMEENQRLTNIYVSDFRGFKFTLSLIHNVRSLDTGNCDFERILGIDGVYIANVYDHSEVEKAKSRDNVSPSHLDQYKKSFISYDRGGNWHSLKAPDVDATGEELNCSGDCSLHLKGRTESNQNPLYSSDNSPGIAVGVGNAGLYLTQKDSEVNTYLTRDGGHTWFEIRKGSHMYEIGDRGGIIVMGRDDQGIDKIIYSWDEGLTWQELKISPNPFMITNIVTEPSNMEQKFIVYGQSGNTESSMVGYVISLNFKELHQRVCSGSWDPNMPESDYEFWIPRNFENGKCLFGRKTKYIRRKREAQCFNQEEIDKKFFIETCPCIEDDWECDYGFYRRIEGGPCIPIAQNFEEDEFVDILKPPENCKDTFVQTRGYRKVSGDYCSGGVDLGPKTVPCPQKVNSTDSTITKEPKKIEKEPVTKQANLEVTDKELIKDVQSSLWTVVLFIGALIGIILFKDKIINIIFPKSQNDYKQNKKGVQRDNYEQISLFQNEDDDEV